MGGVLLMVSQREPYSAHKNLQLCERSDDKSFQVRTEHERAKHAALYVPVTEQPAYNLGKGSVTCKVPRIYSKCISHIFTVYITDLHILL